MPRLKHFVEKSREGTYYTIPFTVPENVSRVTVSYSYWQGTKGLLREIHPQNIIDLGLMDEKRRFLGWSGSAHPSIFVGEDKSTNGYLVQRPESGEWSIIVGAYHVVPAGVEVTYDIEFEYHKPGDPEPKHYKQDEPENISSDNTNAEPELLFGDLHIHTVASDGALDSEAVGKLARDIGLDFVGLANHNNYADNFCLPDIPGLTFIYAVEWTHYKGHMNFFGAKAPFENSFIANTPEEMEKIINDARSLGAVISVNHPKCPFCPYKWNSMNFDMIEVWNGPMRGTNIRGIKWWTQLLREGRRIPAVGGSDFHRPKDFAKLGNPITAVYSPSRRREDILKNIRAGHSFVSSGVDGARLTLTCGDAMMGDAVRYDKNKKLHLHAEQRRGETLVLVTGSGERVIKHFARGNLDIDIEPKNDNFAYVKAIRGCGKLGVVRALTNPIYFQKEEEEDN